MHAAAENTESYSIGGDMIRIDIPQRGTIELEHAVFDVNGTLAVDGIPVHGVADRLQALADLVSLHALTAGTHGNIAELEHALGLPLRIIKSGEEKAEYVRQLSVSQCWLGRAWQWAHCKP